MAEEAIKDSADGTPTRLLMNPANCSTQLNSYLASLGLDVRDTESAYGHAHSMAMDWLKHRTRVLHAIQEQYSLLL